MYRPIEFPTFWIGDRSLYGHSGEQKKLLRILRISRFFIAVHSSGVPRNIWGGFKPEIFFGVGLQQIQLRTEGRENGDLGTVTP
jgi:hypothetical protein